MANPKFTNRKLVLAMSPAFMVQTAFDSAIATANLNYRHPQATPQRHGIQAFREQERSCDARWVVIEELTGKIARFTLGFSASAKFLAGHFSYLQGIAGAPTGTPANESQTLDLNGATAGNFTLELDHEGLAGETIDIAGSAALTAATVQSALENLRPIKAGNVSVSGSAGGPFTISFAGGRLANANIPLITVNDSTTGGTGVEVTAGTDGANKTQLISRTSSESPALWSAVEGFDGESGGMKRYKNLVTDSWTMNINRRGKANLTVVAYGDPIGETLVGYSTPACDTPSPIHAKDSRFLLETFGYQGGDLRELTITESNNIDVSEEALRWDDITPDQLQSGDPTMEINALFVGSPTSDFSEFCEDENNAFDGVTIPLGRPGERFTYLADNVQWRLDDGLTEFVGNRNVSAFRVLGRPSPDVSNVVSRGEYHGAYTGQFLLSS